MSRWCVFPRVAVVTLIAVTSLAPVLTAGQTPATTATRTPQSTPWGDPDLQGLWNNGTTTPLERPDELAGKEFFTDAEVAARDNDVFRSRNTDREPRAGDPGTYNDHWWERGETARNRRTSLIVDPTDGRLPPLSAEGRQRAVALEDRRRSRGPFDSYEDRPLTERCIIYRGIPPIPTGYSNNYHILQTPTYVAILQEHIHDVRLIPLDGRPHIGTPIRQWLGDSRGHWEGQTLVVETTNFSENAMVRGVRGDPSESLRVVERFTRTDAATIDYQFTIEDPRTWTRPWSGAIPMTLTPGPMFEYACHEGNYGLENVLRGARAQERAEAEAPTANQGDR